MENNKELFAKAKAAETPEALLTLAAECVRRDIPAVFPDAAYAENCRIAITAIGALLKKGFGFAITRTNERIQT